MKIAYLLQAGVPEIRRPPFDGPANHVRYVFRELVDLGHEVVLLAQLDKAIWKSHDLENFTRVHVRPFDARAFRLFESAVRRLQRELRLPYATLFESLRFAQACRQELAGYDVFYERAGWVAYGAGLAGRWMGIPLVLEENGNPLLMMDSLGNAPRGFQRRLEVALMGRAMRRAAHVVASGDGWRQHFIERWAFPECQVSTVENGTALVGLLRREQLRSFGAPAESSAPLTLAYVGGFFPWHGVTGLLRAAARVQEQGTDLRLVLIGAGPGYDEARQLAATLGLAGRVTFTGQLDMSRYAPHLASADVGVAPYCGWKEFSGLKILDYKAAGLATIATGINGQPATVRHGQTGLIVEPCNEDALVAAIGQLAADMPLRRQMGQEGRLEAERCHAWRHTAQALEEVFRQVTDKSLRTLLTQGA